MLIADNKPFEILNNLIVINNDRIEGYNYAAKKINVPVLKVLFSRLIETSFVCKKELSGQVYKLGGKPQEGNVTSVIFFIAWLDVITAVGKNDHNAILNSCIKEESIVMQCYEAALNEEDENITTQHQLLFHKHFELINADFNKVKNLLKVLNRPS